MAWYHPKTLFDKIFEYSIILKGIDGLLELLAAVFLIFIKPEQIQGFVGFVTHKEILENPHDFLANFLIHSAADIHAATVSYAIIYLLIHAAIKLIAVVGILRKQLWAYPFSLITLGALVIYQVYSMVDSFSIGMLLLTVFDVYILWMIWREYGTAKRSLGEGRNSSEIKKNA